MKTWGDSGSAVDEEGGGRPMPDDLDPWLKPEAVHHPGLMGFVHSTLPQPLSQWLRDSTTTAMHVLSRPRLRELADRPPLQLNLGCGFKRVDGWVNIDRIGSAADIYWNLRHPLPLADGSVDAIFHEHLIEHLPFGVGLGFIRECHRLLRPGGVLRISVPDAGRQMRRYAEKDPDLLEHAPTRLLGAQPLLTGFGHVSMWDVETLTLFLQRGGFPDPVESAFGRGSVRPVPDSVERAGESLYVEAKKE